MLESVNKDNNTSTPIMDVDVKVNNKNKCECGETAKVTPLQLNYVHNLVMNNHKDFLDTLRIYHNDSYTKLYVKDLQTAHSLTDHNAEDTYVLEVFGKMNKDKTECILIGNHLNIRQVNDIFNKNKDLIIKLMNDELKEYLYCLNTNKMERFLYRHYAN